MTKYYEKSFRGGDGVDAKQRKLLFLFAIILIIISSSLYRHWQKNSAPSIVMSDVPQSVMPAQHKKLATVYISGAVLKPGVITVSDGARVIEVIDLAGGLAQGADVSKLNLAQSVKDGMHINVPGSLGPFRTTSYSHSTKQAGNKVNINTADKTELDKLPGIGPTLAQRILDYREENGPFKNINDLKKVKGMSQSRFDKLKEMITI